MKAAILNILRTRREVVSGETLSTALGTSRVAVWKHIRKLQDLGYDIFAGPKGYQLLDTPDTPFPWEFPGREDRIHYLPRTASTMIAARDLARNGAPHLTTVIAGIQTHGRGRLQRQWLSEAGGVYMTVIVRPDIPLLLSSRVNFIASLTMTRLLRDRYGLDARAKWPNDILAGGKKLLGMLSEMEIIGDMTAHINIGMGLNVNNDPTPHEPGAVSMARLLGKRISRKDLIAAFLDDFEARLAGVDYDTVVDSWKTVAMPLGRRVRVATATEVIEGLAADVDPDGALILTLDDGTQQKVIYGDCFFPSPQDNENKGTPAS
ncbi:MULTISPECIES: biotin--[acetyl-CoA-carboxylase] ligase [Desulfococcus]|jgi:BirA family biotin operon repressor/biotin-[acetyl-CoA-carboxylase] ligase|uniref:Bifunctional ligase/repressor BirA n=1 Tax=Desulfococcus multivorans DSM 2059 TaxID=1121405 RepID=S7TH75_DESML|nr:biotin--[acetyl-CoA-carboxylase] ligase [Desulfococcus multivorans]AOY59968.1 BirA: biotin--acetyl-CoA-carboxylase ligase [Desulfococcus multivorans]AQV02115.1 biotin--[acetyl-CoA-carboxylase] ligase [Desulfococcus multivorans]EPR35965.1 BirA bifunctional protein, biotin operon repressor and biotin/acetyl-CoA-carboxylase ligase [Desulfococcus multivorans DSM 2059]MDX9819129.1 biotin--[acetyl-CoA-carboxylase] ligase [Desulfococcus multivorans]SJZ35988.1 BirA family transcriptional regulator,